MWRPIERGSTLPAMGALESNTLDFKARPTEDAIENAKDVAAFANAQGGTLLIGAAGGSQLKKYVLLSRGEVEKAVAEMDDAIKTRCAPPPLVGIEMIPQDDGFLVAVNVQPFPGQVIGVKLTKPESKVPKSGSERDRELEGLVFFPMRVGTHTKIITPEQLPMFMDAKVRRIAIALEAAVGERVIVLDPYNAEGRGGFSEEADMERVDLLTNSVHMVLAPGGEPLEVQLPIDFIETTCFTGKRWHVYLRGRPTVVKWNPGVGSVLRDLGFVFKASH